MAKNKFLSFINRHLIITNLVIIIIVAVILGWLTMIWIDHFTRHGDDVTVPDVVNLQLSNAEEVLKSKGFKVQIDSMYLLSARPGTICEQTPPANALVKPGKTVTIKYVCYMPKSAKISSSFNSLSGRAAVDELKSLGMIVKEEYVPSSYNGNLVGAFYNGKRIRNSQEIPMGSEVKVQIGEIPTYDFYYETDEPEEDELENIINENYQSFSDPDETLDNITISVDDEDDDLIFEDEEYYDLEQI